jgi:hypothetical protein
MLKTTRAATERTHPDAQQISEPDFRTEAAEMKTVRARRLVLPLTVTKRGASQTVTRASIDQAINPSSTIAVNPIPGRIARMD